MCSVYTSFDAVITGHGVHGDERFIEPFIQVSERFTQGFSMHIGMHMRLWNAMFCYFKWVMLCVYEL